jgi:hypothetical protein
MNIEAFRQSIKSAGLETRKKRNFEAIEIIWSDYPIVSVPYADIHQLQDVSSTLAQVKQRKSEIGKASTRQFKEMLIDAGFFRQEETA